MRCDVATKLVTVAAIAFSLGRPALAEDASVDRASLDAAAGRLVFENVLLADPQAFARHTPVRNQAPPRTIALAVPASTGDASLDRLAFELAAGRPSFRSQGAERPLPPATRSEVSQPGGKRSVRVVLAAPYGQ